MTFRSILRSIVERVDGAVAALLMGLDGIAVDQYTRDGFSFDMESIGMEYSVVLTQVRKAAEMLHAGPTEEVTIQAERMITVLRLVSDEYFVAIALDPQGQVGKAKFVLRTQVSEILRELV
jgi:predicted regulator of Ras-like GTPase activity (Roadblock/LC7/MglB family)